MKTSKGRAWRAALNVGLFATVLALAGFDWLVAPLSADDANHRRNTIDAPRPTAVAPSRDLTASSASTVRVGNVECRIEQSARGYRLLAHNTGTSRESMSLRVARVELVGEAYARMGPMPRVVATDVVTLALAPNGRSVHALSQTSTPAAIAAAAAAQTAATGSQSPTTSTWDSVLSLRAAGTAGFRTVDFRIAREGAPASEVVVVRIAERATSAASSPAADTQTRPNG